MNTRDTEECPDCKGRGRVSAGHKLLRKTIPCRACGGSGRVPKDK